MSYINIEERRKKRKQFTFLYVVTVVLLIAACSAFLAPPQVTYKNAEVKELAVDNNAQQITYLNEQWLQLQRQRTVYNSIANKDDSSENVISIKQALFDKENSFRKFVDSMAVNINSASNHSLIKAVSVYKDILRIQPAVQFSSKQNRGEDNDQFSAISLQLKAKDQKIKLLQDELKAIRKTDMSRVTKNGNSGDTKFLNWALSSQTAAVAKLKNENIKLKGQINDLKKYLQQ